MESTASTPSRLKVRGRQVANPSATLVPPPRRLGVSDWVALRAAAPHCLRTLQPSQPRGSVPGCTGSPSSGETRHAKREIMTLSRCIVFTGLNARTPYSVFSTFFERWQIFYIEKVPMAHHQPKLFALIMTSQGQIHKTIARLLRQKFWAHGNASYPRSGQKGEKRWKKQRGAGSGRAVPDSFRQTHFAQNITTFYANMKHLKHAGSTKSLCSRPLGIRGT